MKGLQQEPTRLDRVSKVLFGMPPGARSETLLHCLGFVPASEELEFSTLGPIRAELATYWEETYQVPVPVTKLRELLVSTSSDVLPLFSAIDDADSADEISRYLAALISRLGRVCRSECDRQLSLLDSAPEERPPAVTHIRESFPATADNLQHLIDAGRKFPTVYADPPWPYDNQASRGAAVKHYPTMSIQDIRAEPVEQLTERNAHLHLWTTNAFFHEALQVIDAWGFKYKSCLVWVKPNLGLGNYWRVGHEFLLLGVKGSLRFRDRSQPSWILAHRTTHSRKPGIIRLLVEKVSPGPYLELFGREEIPNSNWTVFGNDVSKRLF